MVKDKRSIIGKNVVEDLIINTKEDIRVIVLHHKDSNKLLHCVLFNSNIFSSKGVANIIQNYFPFVKYSNMNVKIFKRFKLKKKLNSNINSVLYFVDTENKKETLTIIARAVDILINKGVLNLTLRNKYKVKTKNTILKTNDLINNIINICKNTKNSVNIITVCYFAFIFLLKNKEYSITEDFVIENKMGPILLSAVSTKKKTYYNGDINNNVNLPENINLFEKDLYYKLMETIVPLNLKNDERKGIIYFTNYVLNNIINSEQDYEYFKNENFINKNNF